ncbi:cytochrome P450 [Xylaria venustula]|nr:cytochrome P450 [Xylaria venustula]
MLTNDTLGLGASIPYTGRSTDMIMFFAGPIIAIFLAHMLFSKRDVICWGFTIQSLAKRLRKWEYLLNGAAIIQAGFDRADGKPFEIRAPDARYVFVSSTEHIKEVDSAPDTVLSLQAASKQMLRPIYTMHGFNWFDRRGTEGIGFVRTLRTLLTNNLPSITPDLASLIKVNLLELLDESTIIKGTHTFAVYPIIVKLVILSNNGVFMEAARMYVEETLVCAEMVKLVPKFMSPLVGSILGRFLKSQKIIFDALLPVAEQRCRERDLASLGHEVPKHADCIQWIMETAPRQKPWTAQRIVHELMTIWFGSVHALSTTITFAIPDLCLHPEYTVHLREEFVRTYADFEKSLEGLPVGSFIKESARLTPVEAMSTRRCATQPFKLSDGTTLAIGDWACTPVWALMTSQEYYPEPTTFHGFRFADQRSVSPEAASKFAFLQPKSSKMTEPRQSWHVWGTGRMVCPGRFYATAVMKLILGHIILLYDCHLVDATATRWFTWRSTMLPKEKTMVVFTPVNSSTVT